MGLGMTILIGIAANLILGLLPPAALGGVDERGQHMRPPRDRALARAPRRVGQMMMERDHAQRALRRPCELLAGPAQLTLPEPSGLVPPRSHRVQADDDERVRPIDGLG